MAESVTEKKRDYRNLKPLSEKAASALQQTITTTLDEGPKSLGGGEEERPSKNIQIPPALRKKRKLRVGVKKNT